MILINYLRNIALRFAKLSNFKGNGRSYNDADLFGVEFHCAELSLCQFHGSNLAGANLEQASLICTSLSSETKLSEGENQTNFSGSLLLLSTYDDGKKITREWLKTKGAKNSEFAITNIDELNEMIESSKIKLDAAERYKENINSIYKVLNSMKIRKENSLFIDVNWLSLLEYSTQDNLNVLEQAFTKLNSYILDKEHSSSNEFRFNS